MLKQVVFSFTVVAVLLSSACQTPAEPPIRVNLLNIPQQGGDLNLQSMSADDASGAENPISRQEIDPLTRYVEKYRLDPVMTEYVQKATLQREQLCSRMALFYSRSRLTETDVNFIAGEYSYSCPHAVADLINQRESVIERSYDLN